MPTAGVAFMSVQRKLTTKLQFSIISLSLGQFTLILILLLQLLWLVPVCLEAQAGDQD